MGKQETPKTNNPTKNKIKKKNHKRDSVMLWNEKNWGMNQIFLSGGGISFLIKKCIHNSPSIKNSEIMGVVEANSP